MRKIFTPKSECLLICVVINCENNGNFTKTKQSKFLRLNILVTRVVIKVTSKKVIADMPAKRKEPTKAERQIIINLRES